MKKTLGGIAVALTVLTACSDNKKNAENPYFPEIVDEDTAYVTFEEASGDSLLVGSSTYSVTERELEVLLYQVEEIKSTYMLQLMMENYDKDLQRAKNKVAEAEQSSLCSEAEQETLRNTLTCIEAAMDEKLDNYTVPAEGVVGNLNYLLRSVNNAKSKEELDRVLRGRGGFLQTLPTLHLVIQEPSRVTEVHRLAKELTRAIERKRAELK